MPRLIFVIAFVAASAFAETLPVTAVLPSGATLGAGVVQYDTGFYFYLNASGALMYYDGASWQAVGQRCEAAASTPTPTPTTEGGTFARLGEAGRSLSGNQALLASSGVAAGANVGSIYCGDPGVMWKVRWGLFSFSNPNDCAELIYEIHRNCYSGR